MDLLVSYVSPSMEKEQLKTVWSPMAGDDLMLVDSGAFTAWSKGEELAVEDYADWLDLNDHLLTAASPST